MAPFREGSEPTVTEETLKPQTMDERGNPIDEVLFGPIFDENDFGRLILSGMWKDNIFEENIADATGNSVIRFVTRQKFEELKHAAQDNIGDTVKTQYTLPEDITPREFIGFIHKVYESSQAYYSVEQILAQRLYSTNQHLQQIKQLAHTQLNKGEHEGILTGIDQIADGVNKFVTGLGLEN